MKYKIVKSSLESGLWFLVSSSPMYWTWDRSNTIAFNSWEGAINYMIKLGLTNRNGIWL